MIISRCRSGGLNESVPKPYVQCPDLQQTDSAGKETQDSHNGLRGDFSIQEREVSVGMLSQPEFCLGCSPVTPKGKTERQ